MQHNAFVIGLEFWCAGRRWRCTDVGTRVVVAVSLEPRAMVRIGMDPDDKTRRVETRFMAEDSGDLNGPPYGVAESVFDEYDMKACSITPQVRQ